MNYAELCQRMIDLALARKRKITMRSSSQRRRQFQQWANKMWFKREQKNRRLSRTHVLDLKLRSDQVRANRVRMMLYAVFVPAITFGFFI